LIERIHLSEFEGIGAFRDVCCEKV